MLLREIEDYRLTLDSVSRLGQQLIMNNARIPRLAQQVEAQLQNLEESYMNLQSTAQQIRVSTRTGCKTNAGTDIVQFCVFYTGVGTQNHYGVKIQNR